MFLEIEKTCHKQHSRTKGKLRVVNITSIGGKTGNAGGVEV